MFFTYGLKENIKTITALSQWASPGLKINNLVDLKSGYERYLKKSQPRMDAHERLDPEFVTEYERIEHYASFFSLKSSLNDRNQETVIDRPNTEHIQRTWELQSALSNLGTIAPDLHQIFSLVINYVFCAPSKQAGGGSSSAALGAIWCAHRAAWTEKDMMEFFVHELAHNLLFLDEYRYKHYPDYPAMARPENFARSAILCIPRPLDKVLHSVVVATEILAFRCRVLGHPENPGLHPTSGKLLDNTRRCLSSIRAIPNLDALTTARAKEIIARCEQIAEECAASLSDGQNALATPHSLGFGV